MKSSHFLQLLNLTEFFSSLLKKKKKRLCVYTLQSRAFAAQLQLGSEAKGAEPLISGEAPPASMGEASGQYCGPSLEGRVNTPRAQCTLTPHTLMVRVNFVYKVPFVGEGGESPQL